jgi:hypothetical protein
MDNADRANEVGVVHDQKGPIDRIAWPTKFGALKGRAEFGTSAAGAERLADRETDRVGFRRPGMVDRQQSIRLTGLTARHDCRPARTIPWRHGASAAGNHCLCHT